MRRAVARDNSAAAAACESVRSGALAAEEAQHGETLGQRGHELFVGARTRIRTGSARLRGLECVLTAGRRVTLFLLDHTGVDTVGAPAGKCPLIELKFDNRTRSGAPSIGMRRR